ncbi:MAG: hypothetical protein ACYTGP_09470 [Planctomycetota bacterium]|jgi:hypothetical protein
MIAPLVAAVAAAAPAGVPAYTNYELQVRSNIVDGFNLPPNSSFNSGTPALNDDGTVAMRLIVVGTTGNAGLWVGAGGTGSVVYDAPFGPLLEDASINASGKVAFELFDFGISFGVHVYDPVTGMTQPEVPPGGAFGIDSFTSARINDAGVIGFRAQNFGGNFFMTDDGGVQTQYVAEATSPYGFLFMPSFNNANQIAAKVRVGGTGNDQPDQVRVFESDGSSVLIAVDDDGDPFSPYTGFDNSVSLLDDGRVAFVAGLAGGARGVFLGSSTGVTQIATTNALLFSSIEFFPPSANENGLVAFRAKDAGGNDVVYVGDGTSLVRIVGEHDLLPSDLGTARVDQHDGSVTFGGAVAINADGDVAFAATLTPENDDQVEWGTGLYVAYADGADPCPADLDGSGDVGFGDVLSVIGAWGPCPPGPCPNDLSGNGSVDFADVLVVIAAWGPCP